MMLLVEAELNKLVIYPDSSLRDVVSTLEGGGQGICLVVDKVSNELLGTITDGDIRRHLLQHSQLEGEAGLVANKKPVSAPVGFAVEQYQQICNVNGIRQLPLLGQQRKIQGIFLLTTQSTDVSDCRLVIMAGGKGTRLKPYTNECPKPMLEVGGKPILERIICKAKQEGLRKISISVNYLKEVILNYVGDGKQFGVEVEYLEESMPLGTAGSLSALDCTEKTFIVTNGDVLTDIRYLDILDFHKLNKSAATMAVKSYEWASPYGVVKTNGLDMIGFKEKPVYREYVNAGIYVLDLQCLRALGRGEHCDMPTLFERLRSNNKRIIVYPMHEPWIDIGRQEELIRARENTRNQ